MQQLDNKIKTEQLDNKIQTEHLINFDLLYQCVILELKYITKFKLLHASSILDRKKILHFLDVNLLYLLDIMIHNMFLVFSFPDPPLSG